MAFTPTAALVELRLMAGILKLPALQLQLATGEILLACAKIAKAFTKNVGGNSLSFHFWLFFLQNITIILQRSSFLNYGEENLSYSKFLSKRVFKC